MLPLIGGGNTRFQPVFVGDVAKAVIAGLTGNAKPGEVYELGGPEIMTHERGDGARARLLHAAENGWCRCRSGSAKLKGAVLQLLPNPPLTLDQVRLLETDNVVSEAAIKDGRTLEGLGVEEPVAVETVVPDYLEQYRPRGQFSVTGPEVPRRRGR